MKVLHAVIGFTSLLLVACTSNTEVDSTASASQDVKPSQNHTLNAVLWHQTAAEYKALCYQTYNLSKLQLKAKIQKHAYPYELAPAIVMDLDETVVDNSFFNAQLILDSANYNKALWMEWSNKQNAGAVPGAIEFITYAESLGVKVMFISNRRVAELENTMINLRNLGLPNVDSSQFLLRVDEGSKAARRSQVSENYDIIMLFGDNLADFTEVFDKQSVADRNALVDSLNQKFGDTFIVLPNALYGEWEGALTEYSYSYSAAQKDSIRKNWLKGY